MSYIASLGLLLAVSAATPAAAHSLTVQHSSGPIQADYRSTVHVQQRQIGSPGPGGRPSTLRCAWTANLAVDRTATTETGVMASRSFVRNDVATGSHPGWCNTNRAAITRVATAHVGDTDRHIAVAAQEDRPLLHAELDQMTAKRLANGS